MELRACVEDDQPTVRIANLRMLNHGTGFDLRCGGVLHAETSATSAASCEQAPYRRLREWAVKDSNLQPWD